MGNGEGGDGEVCAGLDAALLSRDYGGQRGLKSRGITREQLFETVLPFRSYSLPASVIKIYAQHLTESFTQDLFSSSTDKLSSKYIGSFIVLTLCFKAKI